jgi:hypothetical protein
MTHSAEQDGVSQGDLLLGVPFTQHEQGSGQEDSSGKRKQDGQSYHERSRDRESGNSLDETEEKPRDEDIGKVAADTSDDRLRTM